MGAFMGFMRSMAAARQAGVTPAQASFKTLLGVYKAGAAPGVGDGIKGNAATLGLQAVNAYIGRFKNPPSAVGDPVTSTAAPPKSLLSMQPSGTMLLGTHTLLGQ